MLKGATSFLKLTNFIFQLLICSIIALISLKLFFFGQITCKMCFLSKQVEIFSRMDVFFYQNLKKMKDAYNIIRNANLIFSSLASPHDNKHFILLNNQNNKNLLRNALIKYFRFNSVFKNTKNIGTKLKKRQLWA